MQALRFWWQQIGLRWISGIIDTLFFLINLYLKEYNWLQDIIKTIDYVMESA